MQEFQVGEYAWKTTQSGVWQGMVTMVGRSRTGEPMAVVETDKGFMFMSSLYHLHKGKPSGETLSGRVVAGT